MRSNAAGSAEIQLERMGATALPTKPFVHLLFFSVFKPNGPQPVATHNISTLMQQT